MEKLGAEVEPLVREATQKKWSAEARRRLDVLLDSICTNPCSPETLRRLRTITILEQLGTKEAREVLELVSEGGPLLLQTEEAKMALRRLESRQRPCPPAKQP
jgi:hypothetical protein